MKAVKNNAQAKALPYYAHAHESEQRQERKADKERRNMRRLKKTMWNS